MNDRSSIFYDKESDRKGITHSSMDNEMYRNGTPGRKNGDDIGHVNVLSFETMKIQFNRTIVTCQQAFNLRVDRVDRNGLQVVVYNYSYVYSAYYDGRLPDTPLLRVIVMTNIHGKEESQPAYCQVWYKGRSQPEVVHVRRKQAGDRARK